ncbi:MAG: head maturation protease, ClpP-related [Actinomycetota bacterium]
MNPKPILEIASSSREAMLKHFGVPETDAAAPTFEIVDESDDTAVVRIYDRISSFWGVNAADFVEEISAITKPKIRVEMSSPGGSVFDGIAIYNALRVHPAEITTRADSLVASIASVIFQAGDTRQMMTGSQLMIHKAWGLEIGNADDHLAFAELLEKQDGVIAEIYAAKSDHDAEHFAELMTAETWLTHTEAIDEGLADETLDPSASDDAEPDASATPPVQNSTPTKPKWEPPQASTGDEWVREYINAEPSAPASTN